MLLEGADRSLNTRASVNPEDVIDEEEKVGESEGSDFDLLDEEVIVERRKA